MYTRVSTHITLYTCIHVFIQAHTTRYMHIKKHTRIQTYTHAYMQQILHVYRHYMRICITSQIHINICARTQWTHALTSAYIDHTPRHTWHTCLTRPRIRTYVHDENTHTQTHKHTYRKYTIKRTHAPLHAYVHMCMHIRIHPPPRLQARVGVLESTCRSHLSILHFTSFHSLHFTSIHFIHFTSFHFPSTNWMLSILFSPCLF